MSDDLVAFIEARIAEDEPPAREAAGELERGPSWTAISDAVWKWDSFDADHIADHIARHDPARILREVEAKHRLLVEHQRVLLRKGGGADYFVTAWVCRTCGGSDASYDDGTPCMRAAKHPCQTLLLLAAPYADHADFLPEWLLEENSTDE